MITHVLPRVEPPSPVDMTASTLVKTAIQRPMVRSPRELTVFVRRNAVDRTRHVVTHVWVPATATVHVRFAMNHVRSAAVTHAAVKSAKSLACHVLKIALGLVHIVGNARCHARCLATFCLARNVARRFWAVAIDVRLSVGRFVQVFSTARSAPIRRSRR